MKIENKTEIKAAENDGMASWKTLVESECDDALS